MYDLWVSGQQDQRTQLGAHRPKIPLVNCQHGSDFQPLGGSKHQTPPYPPDPDSNHGRSQLIGSLGIPGVK